MNRHVSSDLLLSLTPLLDSLARLVASGASLDDSQLAMLLDCADLGDDPAAAVELQRWARLLRPVHEQPTPAQQQLAKEALLLRGLPEEAVHAAVAIVASDQNPRRGDERASPSVGRRDGGQLQPGPALAGVMPTYGTASPDLVSRPPRFMPDPDGPGKAERSHSQWQDHPSVSPHDVPQRRSDAYDTGTARSAPSRQAPNTQWQGSYNGALQVQASSGYAPIGSNVGASPAYPGAASTSEAVWWRRVRPVWLWAAGALLTVVLGVAAVLLVPRFILTTPKTLSRIAVSVVQDGSADIFVVNPDGSEQRQLTNTRGGSESEVVWSPDGHQVIYELSSGGNSDLYIMNADGTQRRQLTNTPDVDEWVPVWSPDGHQVGYELSSGGNSDLYIMNADGTQQRQLTNTPDVREEFGGWSPDSTQIAYTAKDDDNFDVYIMSADGAQQRQLTAAPEDEFFGEWSPDGKQLVYTIDAKDGSDVYIMNADGTQQRQLTNTPDVMEYIGGWSPDGKQMAYMEGDLHDTGDLYIVNADGTQQRQLTNTPDVVERFCCWSPDGKQLVYTAKGTDGSDVYIMNADGTQPTRITTLRGKEIWGIDLFIE